MLTNKETASKEADSYSDIDNAIKELQANKEKWANEIPIEEKIELLQKCRDGVASVAEEWIAEDLKARKVNAEDNDSWVSIMGGPALALRNINAYIKTLKLIQNQLPPTQGLKIKQVGDNQLAVQTFPDTFYDRLIFTDRILWGFTGEVWMKPGIKEQDLNDFVAASYKGAKIPGSVCLVLGAGNISGIAPSDILYKMFVEKQCVLMKSHPVIDYLGKILEKAFSPLIQEGYLRIAYGGADIGAYIAQHPGIEAVHLTGSDKTFEKIVFGTGPEGEENKRLNRPAIHKKVSSELGNVSPVIIVPGPWTPSDIAYQAASIASGLTCNGGFNCIANRVIIQQNGWNLRDRLIDQVEMVLQTIPTHCAYYPGSENKLEKVLQAYPTSKQIGPTESGKTPWVFLTHLDPEKPHYFFREEVFASFMCETSLNADSISDYLAKAVEFCNHHLWGTLSATLIVHPKSLEDPSIRQAVEKAISDLKYGIISVNQLPHIVFFLKNLTWGGFPGSPPNDIQSGVGVVNNSYMLDKAQKSVFRAPFKIWPKPLWFSTNKLSPEIARKFLEFEKKRTLFGLIKLFFSAIKGSFSSQS